MISSKSAANATGFPAVVAKSLAASTIGTQSRPTVSPVSSVMPAVGPFVHPFASTASVESQDPPWTTA